jgi:transposase-like protein
MTGAQRAAFLSWERGKLFVLDVLRAARIHPAAQRAALMVVCSPKTVPPVAQVLDCSGQKLGQGRRLAMKKSYTPEGIVRILQDVQAQLAAGASLREVARQLGVNPGTLCRWQRRYGGVQIDEARRMFLLEKENVRLKRIVAELELDKSILKESLQGKY